MKASDNQYPKVILEERLSDGSDTGNPAADHRALFLGEDGALHLRDSAGTVTAVGGTGGGLSQSYVGYDTVGGSWAALTAGRQIVKKVTLAAAATFTSIDIYLRANVDNYTDLEMALLTDNGGVPDLLIAVAPTSNILLSNATTGFPHGGRWVGAAIGNHVAAGDYWIGFRAGNNYFDITYDGSGSDVYWQPGALVSGYHSALAQTTGSLKYSIRASILS